MKRIKQSAILVFALFFFGDTCFSQTPTDGMVDAINQMGDDEVQNIQDHWSHLENIDETITEGIGHLNTALSIASSASDLYHASLALDNNECVPDLSVDAAHTMPTSCQENGACQTCYSGAYHELSFIRRMLARLHCIYANTRNFNQSALAFGDNTSGIHAVTGLSWQSARAGIVEEYNNFKHTYDDKYVGMIGTLQKALEDIGHCEEQFGQHDWYQRFGFIYFEMMKEKYKRTD